MKKIYWNKERCTKEALKYKSRSVFKKQSSGAFGSAYKNGWMNEICSHMKVIGNRLSRLVYVYEFDDNSVYVGLTHDIDERDKRHKIDKRSKVYQHIKKNKLKPILTYSKYMTTEDAIVLEREKVKEYQNNGFKILNIATPGGIGGGYIKWTLEKCEKEALKFNSRINFARKNNSAYNSARRYGWLDKICVHMITVNTKPIGYWTKERCIEEAKKYKTKSDLYENSPGAYMSMLRNDWLIELCPHMKTKKANGYWTKEKCLEEALKYNSKSEFNIKSGGAYRVILKNNWINDMCSHMKNVYKKQ